MASASLSSFWLLTAFMVKNMGRVSITIPIHCGSSRGFWEWEERSNSDEWDYPWSWTPFWWWFHCNTWAGENIIKFISLITSSCISGWYPSNEINAGVTSLDKGVQTLATKKYVSLCCKLSQKDLILTTSGPSWAGLPGMIHHPLAQAPSHFKVQMLAWQGSLCPLHELLQASERGLSPVISCNWIHE